MLKWIAAATVLASAALSLALLFLADAAGSASAAMTAGGQPTALALSDIPPKYLAWYMAAPPCAGLPWPVLAGIGKVESDHGRSTAPGVHSGANSVGAEGPMQFEPATFAEFAVNADPARPLTPYDPVDAIWTAAAMLCASGAAQGTPAGIRQAVFTYNHSTAYVTDVLSWANRYATPAASSPAAAAAISFALAQLGKPYQWGATGPAAFDCSGLVFAAYANAGIAIGRTTFQWRDDGPVIPITRIQPGDLLFSAGSDGTPTDPGHVVMYLGGGQVIQAPKSGKDVQVDPLDLSGVVVVTRPAGLPRHPATP